MAAATQEPGQLRPSPAAVLEREYDAMKARALKAENSLASEQKTSRRLRSAMEDALHDLNNPRGNFSALAAVTLQRALTWHS